MSRLIVQGLAIPKLLNIGKKLTKYTVLKNQKANSLRDTLMKTQISSDITLCQLVNGYRHLDVSKKDSELTFA